MPDRPVSLEVFADEFDEMIAQGRTIASWGKNANVKIPVSNTRAEFSGRAIRTLAEAGAAAGCYTVLLDRRYGENAGREIRADVTVRSLPEAARHLLSRIGSRQATHRKVASCPTSPR